MLEINYLAVLAAVIANFFLGFVWYTPLFGRAWAKEMGYDTNMEPKKGEMARGLIIMIIGNFFMAYVFAHNMAAWTFVPDMDKMPVIGTILNSVIFTWLGFYVPVDLTTVAWERRSWKLFWINTGYHLAMLFVAATILALWR